MRLDYLMYIFINNHCNVVQCLDCALLNSSNDCVLGEDPRHYLIDAQRYNSNYYRCLATITKTCNSYKECKDGCPFYMKKPSTQCWCSVVNTCDALIPKLFKEKE